MLVLCYPVLVSLALAAPGISRTCYDYCKTQGTDPVKDAFLECDCADFLDTISDSDESSMIILDDTGVYFVPAETHTSQSQFSSRPFFISNPAKLIPKTKNRINRDYVTIKEPLNDPEPSQSAHLEIYKITETISHASIKESLGKSPLYLDIEIQEPTDKDRAAVQQYTLIEDFESTEQTLLECLDFHVIHYTRKYGFMEKIREFWVARNLDKYEHVSDTAIDENIRKWCSEPEFIVQQSLEEIKKGLPKKEPDSRSENNENKNQYTGAKELTTLITPSSLHYNVTKPPVTYDKSTEGFPENITEIYGTTYDPTEDWPFIGVTSPPNLKEEDVYQIQNSSSPVDVVSDTTGITTENTLIFDNPGNTIIVGNQPNRMTTSYTEHDLDTMASEDVFYPYVPAVTELNILNDTHHLDNKTTIIQNPTTTTTPLSTEESLERQSSVTDESILDVLTLDANNTLSHNTSNVLTTDTYLETREKYEEKNIRIPKIITKECHNTIQTTIDGFEQLPNNDFKDYASQSERIEQSNGNSELNITGRLYFVSKKELVPVRFVQTDTGTISLGVDVPTLCEKLVFNTNVNSHFLTVLCNDVQSNDDQHESSSMIYDK